MPAAVALAHISGAPGVSAAVRSQHPGPRARTGKCGLRQPQLHPQVPPPPSLRPRAASVRCAELSSGERGQGSGLVCAGHPGPGPLHPRALVCMKNKFGTCAPSLCSGRGHAFRYAESVVPTETCARCALPEGPCQQRG
eukprot:693340-Rhodomonas_salina.1